MLKKGNSRMHFSVYILTSSPNNGYEFYLYNKFLFRNTNVNCKVVYTLNPHSRNSIKIWGKKFTLGIHQYWASTNYIWYLTSLYRSSQNAKMKRTRKIKIEEFKKCMFMHEKSEGFWKVTKVSLGQRFLEQIKGLWKLMDIAQDLLLGLEKLTLNWLFPIVKSLT